MARIGHWAAGDVGNKLALTVFTILLCGKADVAASAGDNLVFARPGVIRKVPLVEPLFVGALIDFFLQIALIPTSSISRT